jgi:3-hydroxyacyl-CoA dehydrogenase
VFEDFALKRDIAATLGRVMRPGATIASNTSTLDVDELAQASGRASDFLGMHFFSPANIMRLVEVVRGEATAPDALATAIQVGKRIGKVPVVSGVCYGFIGNRMLEPYLREAESLLLEGAPVPAIDGAIESLGLAMGPLRMLDLAGVDVAAKVVIERDKAGALPDDPAYRVVVRKLFENGRLGQKTAAGFYRYEGRSAIADPAVDAVTADLARGLGVARREGIGADEIVERCLYPLINEGVRILEEGIAYRPGDVDVVWTSGYGFPDALGGPLWWADSIGLRRIVDRLDAYAAKLGNRAGYWTVSPTLREYAQAGKRISDWSPGRA